LSSKDGTISQGGAEVADSHARLGPDDVDDLTVARLTMARDWLAVAAVALHVTPPDLPAVLQALAACCDDPDAFAWFWALVQKPALLDTDAGWDAFAQLPEQVKVPDSLQEAVVTFIATPESSIPRMAGRAARTHLLARAPRGLARTAARRALEEASSSEPPVKDVVDAAVTRLAGNTHAGDRRLVVAELERRSPPERLAGLEQLKLPMKPDEVAVLASTVTEVLRTAPASDVATLSRVRAVWLRLPLGSQRSILAGVLTELPEMRHQLLTAEFAEATGVAGLLSLLAPGPVEDDAQTLIAEATSADVVLQLMGVEVPGFAGELLHRAHDVLEADSLRPAREKAASLVAPLPSGHERRAELQSALLRVAARLREPAVSGVVIGTLLPGELPPLVDAAHLDQSVLAGFFGSFLADFLEHGAAAPGEPPAIGHTSRSQDVVAVLRTFEAAGLARVAVDFLGGELTTLSAGVRAFLLEDPHLVRAASEEGYGDELLDYLETGEHELPELAPLRDSLLTIMAHAPSEATVERAFRTLEPDLATLDEEAGAKATARRLTEALTSWPGLLMRLAEEQLATLDGPQALAAPAARLAVLLDAALAAGLAASCTAPVESLRRVMHGPRVLHPLAAQWFTEATPDEALVDLCVSGDLDYAGKSPYRAARISQAERLSAVALDAHQATAPRVTALQNANRADSSSARRAALNVGVEAPVDLRQEAARILAASVGSHDEIQTLQRLVEEEADGNANGDLLRALRRIESGDAGEALRNLLQLVGCEQDPGDLQLMVVLPYPEWHSTFQHCVDEARSSLTGAPSAAVQAFLRLGEHLVELALTATFLLSPKAKRRAEGEKLRENSHDKPDIGALVKQQELVQHLPWLISYSALRELRSVHPAPVGKTTPVNAVDADVVTAKRLTLIVVEGWLKTMYEAYDATPASEVR
jgi:hypothetical protein